MLLTTEYLVPGISCPELGTIEFALYGDRLRCATSPLAALFGIDRDGMREQVLTMGPDDAHTVPVREIRAAGFTMHSPRGQTLATLPALCRLILARDDLARYDAAVYRILDHAADIRNAAREEPPATAPLGLMYADLYSRAWLAHERASAEHATGGVQLAFA